MEQRQAKTVTDLFSLIGQVALVTGAARGLGFHMATALAEAGALVVINGRDAGRLEDARALLVARGLSVETACFDVADEHASAAAIDRIARDHGWLDILINNVVARLRRPVSEIDVPALRGMIDANLVAPYQLGKCAIEHMKARNYGRIVMVSSVAATKAMANNAAYVASKGGLVALTRAFAAEFGRSGITCNALSLGHFLTEENEAKAHPPSGPLGRWGELWEVGAAALFLASPASSYVTGTVLEVDGGVSNCF